MATELARKLTKKELATAEALGVQKGELVPQYKVVVGCDAADGTRYEVGADYDPLKHEPHVTKGLMENNCLEEVDLYGNRIK